MNNFLLQLSRFGIVGLTAAALHFTVVVMLVQKGHWLPLSANMIGFAAAFQISYFGHRLWTFSDTTASHQLAFPKLLTVQLFNLSANQCLFYIFLMLQLPYPVALLLVLGLLPIFTFFVSKRWVFK